MLLSISVLYRPVFLSKSIFYWKMFLFFGNRTKCLSKRGEMKTPIVRIFSKKFSGSKHIALKRFKKTTTKSERSFLVRDFSYAEKRIIKISFSVNIQLKRNLSYSNAVKSQRSFKIFFFFVPSFWYIDFSDNIAGNWSF